MFKVLFGFLFAASSLAAVPPTSQESAYLNFKPILVNPGFENGSTKWTASGGTFTVTTTTADVGSGLRAGSWDSSSASQTLTSTAVAIPAGDYGANYEVSANLKCATGTCTHTIQAFDGTNIVASQRITSSLTYTRSTLNFVAPSSGNLSARIVSVNANEPILYVDDVYLGRARNIGSSAQAQFVGSILWPKTTNCLWTRTSNSTFGSFSADSDCTTPTGSQLVGSAIAPGTKIPAVSFSNLSPARYMIVAQGAFNSGGAFQCGFSITDGTRRTTPVYSTSSGTAGQITGFIDISTATSSTTTFEIQASGNGTNGECQINNTPNSPDMGDVSIQVYRFPSSSEIAVRPELQNLIASAYHSNNCGWARSSSSYGDPAGDATCTFTQVVNSNGTITSALSGSDPLPGVIFTPNTAGTYKVCVNGPSFSTGSGVGALQLLNSTSSVQLGEISSTTYTRIPFYMCGLVEASSISPVTVKLQIRNTAAANADIDVNTSASDRTLYWTVEKITQNTPSPVLVGSVTSQSTGALRVESATITNNGSACATSISSSSWITAQSRSSGVCTSTIASGVFASTPMCVCTAMQIPTAGGICAIDNTISATSINTVTRDVAGNQSNQDRQLLCFGPRGSL
jgi:hypothetical protein